MAGPDQAVVVPDTLGFLLGTWAVSRVVDDDRSGERWSFEGTAHVVPGVETLLGPDAAGASDPASASYFETGVLHGPDHAGLASRSLVYERDGGTSVLVRFGDGRPFVDLDLTTGGWRSLHRCGEDRYEITTVVRDGNLVEERWRVTGPETDYEALTTLRRC